jgi:hypothetical protein
VLWRLSEANSRILTPSLHFSNSKNAGAHSTPYQGRRPAHLKTRSSRGSTAVRDEAGSKVNEWKGPTSKRQRKKAGGLGSRAAISPAMVGQITSQGPRVQLSSTPPFVVSPFPSEVDGLLAVLTGSMSTPPAARGHDSGCLGCASISSSTSARCPCDSWRETQRGRSWAGRTGQAAWLSISH